MESVSSCTCAAVSGVLVDISTEIHDGLVRKWVGHMFNYLKKMHANHVRLSCELSNAVLMKQFLRLCEEAVHLQCPLTLDPWLQYLLHNQDFIFVHT